MNKALVFVGLAALSSACGAPQKPTTFTTSGNVETGIDVVARTLATEGYSSPVVNRQSGIVNTEWKDTGFMFGQVQNSTATIVRRFTVVLAPAAQGATVTVRMDAKRCAQGGFIIEAADVRGTCEEMTVIPEKLQIEVDALGAKMQQALAGGPAAAKAP